MNFRNIGGGLPVCRCGLGFRLGPALGAVGARQQPDDTAEEGDDHPRQREIAGHEGFPMAFFAVTRPTIPRTVPIRPLTVTATPTKAA